MPPPALSLPPLLPSVAISAPLSIYRYQWWGDFRSIIIEKHVTLRPAGDRSGCPHLVPQWHLSRVGAKIEP